jgi:hypothetical protein
MDGTRRYRRGYDNTTAELRKVADQCADKVRLLKMDARTTMQVLTTRILPTLQYPLLALSLSEEQCTHIMAPVVKAVLSVNGVASTFPRALVYGPRQWQGLALQNLYTIQGLKHVEALLSPSTKLGTHLMRAAIESTIIEAGVPGPLLMQPSTIPYLRFWLAAVRAARLVQQPREVRQSGMREIMYRFLQSRREGRGPA